jgi:hypothetical protein
VRYAEFGPVVTVSPEVILGYSLTYIGLGLVMVFLGATLIQWVTEGFNFDPGFGQCFTVAAYGFSPIFLAHLLDSFPQINTWLCWGIGAVGIFFVLYHGIALVLKPDITKGFGLYLLSSLLLVILSLLGHFVMVSVLFNKFMLF